jgi:hypothetical protein
LVVCQELFDHLDRVFCLVDEEQVAGARDDVLTTVGDQRREDLVVDRWYKWVVLPPRTSVGAVRVCNHGRLVQPIIVISWCANPAWVGGWVWCAVSTAAIDVVLRAA